MDEKEINIEYLNQLKNEYHKWMLMFVIVAIIVFLGPFLAIFLIFVFSHVINSKGINVSFLGGGFAVFVPIFVVAFVAFVVILIKMTKKKSLYREAYKSYFSHRVLKGLLEDYQYNHSDGISSSELSGIGMVRLGNRFHSEDYVSGKYKDVNFRQSDLLVQNVTRDSDGDTHTETYFRGQWLVFEFPRRFVTKLAVTGRGCRMLIQCTRGMEKFSTESTEFNKMFDVFMQDGVEMFYLLDPKMIEAMQSLGEKYGGMIAFLFVDKKLHIGLNNGADSFEPPKNTKTSIGETEEIKRLSEEFKTVFGLIDVLELNKKIFK